MSNSVFSAVSPFNGLEPASVWAHFATICSIPHGSKDEAALRDCLQQWADGKGLSTLVDTAGNLIIRKPATPGYESVPGTILQAHLDMVCQKNDATTHDFARDPIRPVVRDGFLIAEHTTLGADNGIGVALALAALEDDTFAHGPIEALLTVDEEAGMSGAHNLPTDVLHSQYMLNLDTETWGEIFLGCAGGMDVNVQHVGTADRLPSGWQAVRIALAGLRGGHSGININTGRGNAIKLLVRILCALEQRFGIRLSTLTGGTARNALPREATATVAIAPEHLAALDDALSAYRETLSSELRGAEHNLRIECQPAHTDRVMSVADQRLWLQSLHAAPHGVKRMSSTMPGVIETSNNLGMVDLSPTDGSCNFMPRSNQDSACDALADEIVSLFALSGMTATKSNYYPGWVPNPDSKLLALCQNVYTREFGAPATTQVIHAGLECGIIGAKYPALDIISFGPTILNPHAPGESVEIASVEKSWHLLKALLSAMTPPSIA